VHDARQTQFSSIGHIAGRGTLPKIFNYETGERRRIRTLMENRCAAY